MMQSVVVKHGKGTLKEMIADRDLLANLIIMAFIWSITAFAYYLGKYQVTAVAGDVYVNSVTSSISDIISRPIGLVLYRYMTARKVIIVFFTRWNVVDHNRVCQVDQDPHNLFDR